MESRRWNIGRLSVAPEKEQGALPTNSSHAAVVVLAKLHSQLDDDPDANGDEAGGSDVGHDLRRLGVNPCNPLQWPAPATSIAQQAELHIRSHSPSGCLPQSGHLGSVLLRDRRRCLNRWHTRGTQSLPA